ncbi:hypothetical protein D9757_011391 [Collybiopsis confluens]|uniref:DUF6533 domain-containing protein n=1 Tax=Collybiopsis confluens TaxID=2823264 RepID=A0A8H5GL14_9AGAR|nr:hypothetical protein D9757_011391 [Collybiopsis confluens]
MNSTELEELNFWMLGNYAFAASAALWILDFVATLPTEIRTLWLRKPTGPSVLFILNRYFCLLFLSLGLVAITPGNSTDQECQIPYNSYQVLETLSVVMTTLFALRVYAIYNKSHIILVISALLITFRLFTDTLLIPHLVPHFRSFQDVNTWLRVNQNPKAKVLATNQPIVEILNSLPAPISLPNILISRLVLNLRTFSSLEETRSQTISTISGLNFATNRMLGNIGAPMRSGEVEQEEEDVEE